jgi:hypothetical protein
MTRDLNSLDSFCQNLDDVTEKWRQKFITQPKLFDAFGRYKFIRYIDDEKIYILKKARRSGEHSELFSLALYNELKGSSTTPFQYLKYYSPSGETETPCLYYDQWKYNSHNFELDVSYNGNSKFKLDFYDKNYKLIEDEIKETLINLGFTQKESSFELYKAESEIKEYLQHILNTLMLII